MTIVAAIQMNSSDQVSSNLEKTAELVMDAKKQNARIAILPECFAMMARNSEQRQSACESFQGEGSIEEFLSNLARINKIWLISAGLFSAANHPGKVRNTCLVHDDKGRRLARYDKMHLFNVNLSDKEQYSESTYTEPGDEYVVLPTPAGNVGLTVCYDMRFPEMYQKLASKGAQWFIVPSAFADTTGKVHWEILLRARAIENLAYVVAPAQYGLHPGGRMTYGRTMIVGPWGEIIAEKEQGAGVVLGDIDLNRLVKIRESFPALRPSAA